ncbi:uncharacterized protein LOC113874431 [Abrus precatorius]|uniref:Uncharacterized protein LOC113874431 n=1 Tax=Abrus precatorius TaxID=3816 RepID=A0A8B8MIP9_ABRPR|nr:uncharacterized protein LOC113874431 [Abrus precatorius]
MEINVGSSSSDVRSVELRRKLHLRVKMADTASLRGLGKKLKTVQQLTLLAPTLEEFEQILDLPLEGRQPYRPMEHHASLPTIANVLRIHPAELQQAYQEKHQNRGFTREFLERQTYNLAEKEDWETFMDVLALTIYGIVLFPKHDNFVDLVSIDVFLACKNRSENPVPALLADVYCTLSFCHERKGKRIICCLPMLYIWLTTHVFKRPSEIKCPITNLLRFQTRQKNGQEWANHLASVNEGHIRWHTPWQQSTTIIYHCGNYPNVPLMGTRGCINYNLIMGQRQLAYPMMGPPAEELLVPFVVYYEDGNFIELIQKARNAWAKVVRKGKELGVRSCAAKASYRQWVKERVQEIKLPFKDPSTSQESEPSNPEPFENEEVKELKKSVQSHAAKVQRYLEAASKELGLRVKERNAALYEKRQLKGVLYNAKGDKEEALTQANELQTRVQNMEEQIKKIVMACEAEINAEKWEVIRIMKEYKAIVKVKDGQIEEGDKLIEY